MQYLNNVALKLKFERFYHVEVAETLNLDK